MITLRLGIAPKSRKLVNTGKGIFSRIREEDRDDAALAYEYEKTRKLRDKDFVRFKNGFFLFIFFRNSNSP